METTGLVGASLEGFRILRREPLAVLIWCGVTGALLIWPVLLMMSQMVPMFVAMANEAEQQTDSTAFPPEFLQFFLRFQLLNVLSIVGRLAWFSIFNAAIMRVVLRPEDRGRFYLKVGMDEVWQAALGVIFYFGYSMVLVLGIIIALIPGLIVGALSVPAGVAVGAVTVIAACGAILWLFLRLSMAFPLTFLDREFRLFESWKLTRGRAGGLFGMALCAVVFAFLIEMVVLTLSMIPLAPWILSLDLPTAAEPDAAQMAAIINSLWPLGVALAIILPILITLMSLVTSAPWAEACRRLMNPTPPASTPA